MGSGPVRGESTLASGKPAGRRWIRRCGWVLFATALLVLPYLARDQWLPLAGRYLDIAEVPAKSDYVFVLGGGTDVRPFVGAALYKAGLTKQLLVPTIALSTEAEDGLVPPEHEIIAEILRRRGVPSQAIIQLPGECRTTFDEARALAKFLDNDVQSSISIVTTTYHTRRVRFIFRQVLGDQVRRIRFVAAPTDGFDETNWWHFESGFMTYTNEYLKLIFYRLRY